MAPRTRLNTPEMRARVGERIKVAAAQAGLTLKLLAQSAGVTPGLVYQYVRGITAVPDDVLERIAAVTRVHIDFFNPEKDHRAGFTQPIESAAQVESESNRDPATRAAIHAELRHLQALAAAQKHPKQDRAAYTESLLQMLALARTIQNRQQEGWILWMLGIARFEAGELDEARQNLLAARELFDQESMKEYSALAALDLARLLAEQGAFDAAEKYLQDLLPAAGATISWRTFISLASLRYRQYDFGGALTLLARAAEQIQTVDPEEKERDAMPLLITHLADVVRATGHPEQAMMLWSKCLNQAAQDRRADWFLEALMEVAACCQQLGRMSEARQRLELAVVLAGFLFEDEARLGIARSLLADVLTAMGNVEEGRSAARASQRIASKVRAARPTILAALAVAEASLASGQPEDALVYAQEALEEARRTKRTREVARAREVRARACLLQWDRRTRAQDSAGAQSALAEAFSEASSALEMAQKAESVHDVIAARLSLARSAMARGSFSEADSEITEVLRLTGEGAIGLSRLLGDDAQALPDVMKSTDLDVTALFSSPAVSAPVLEWQARYLQGVLIARELGPVEAFPALLEAARVVSTILSGLTKVEAEAFRKRHPDAASVFRELQKCAITDSTRQESERLIAASEWAVVDSQVPAHGSPPASV